MAITAGVLAALACAAVLLRRARRDSAPGAGRTAPPDEAGFLPAPGDTVRVRTHFGEQGGYVDHHGLLLWAVPADAAAAEVCTPGTVCTVTAVDVDGDAVGLTVGRRG
jgi:hypothetical protein